MVLWKGDGNSYKQGGYHLILRATRQWSAGCVNRDEIRYIFRNRRLVPGIGLPVDRKVARIVARNNGSRNSLAAGCMKAECDFAVAR